MTQPAILAGRQVAELERFASVVAGGVHQPLAVGARHRAERAFGLVGAHQRAAGLAIELGDLVLPESSRVAARRAAPMMLRSCLLLGLLGHVVARNVLGTLPLTLTQR